MNAPAIALSQPSGARAVRAFEHASDMEADINRVNGVLRMFIMMDASEVYPDGDDASAVLELIYGAQEAMARIEAKREAVFKELHPFRYPTSGEEAVA